MKKNVLAMSFAPRDSHVAQVQFALERGVPAGRSFAAGADGGGRARGHGYDHEGNQPGAAARDGPGDAGNGVRAVLQAQGGLPVRSSGQAVSAAVGNTGRTAGHGL